MQNAFYKPAQLPNVIGITFALLFLIFSVIGLVSTYLTTNHLVGKQLSDTFQQKFTISSNIISHQDDLILHALGTVSNNQSLTNEMVTGSAQTTQDELIELFDSTIEYPLDILFCTNAEDTVFADASSPFFNPAPVLPLIAERIDPTLSAGEIIRVRNEDTDLTILIRSVKLTNMKTGKVVGNLYGGIVLNNNMSLLQKIRKETRSTAVLLLSGTDIVGSTELPDSVLTKTMEEHSLFKDTFRMRGGQSIVSPKSKFIVSPRMQVPQGHTASVTIVFAVSNEILMEIKKSYQLKGVGLVVGVITFLLLSIFVVRKITFIPLRNLLNYSKEVSSGNMTASFTRGGIDEFNSIGKAMEKMVAHLQEINEQLQTDIKYREQAEKSLKTTEIFLNSIIDNIPSMIFVKDAKDLRFLRFNKAGEDLIGYKQEYFIGKCDYDFFPKEEADFFTAKDREVLKCKKPIDIPEETLQTRMKGERILHTVKIPIMDDQGLPLFLLGISEDITEKRRDEDEKEILKSKLNQAKKMEAIGLMAGGVAHDLNNILAGIVGYPELLLHKLPADSELRKPLQAIYESGNRATLIVEDLLTVARDAVNIKEPHNLIELTREYLNSPEGKKHLSLYPNICVKCHFTAEHPFVLCSSVHVKKCIMNLVINSTEAIANTGQINLLIYNKLVGGKEKITLNLEEGMYVVIAVEDNGGGISQDDIEHIFEPFYTKKKMGRSGTGLGLAVVWNTMESHQGTVHVKSAEGKTSFQLYFPNVIEHTPDKQDSLSEDLSGNNEHILVVDDEPHLREIASQMLESMGYVVSSVESGEKAIEFVKNRKVDAIVIDMLMGPGINGRQTYERILELAPGQKAIITSGYSENEDVLATLRLGANSFVKKPYSIQQLGSAVKDALRVVS